MLAWCRRRSSPCWRAGVASMACRLRLKKRFEIDSCTIEYLSGEVLREVLLTIPSEAAKNARRPPKELACAGKTWFAARRLGSFKTPSAKTASRRRDRPRQALATPRAAHGDDTWREHGRRVCQVTTALKASGTPIQRLGGSAGRRKRGAACRCVVNRVTQDQRVGRRAGGGKLVGQLFWPPL